MAFTQREAAEYLAPMSTELAKLAQEVGLETLVHLYSMASLEARNAFNSEGRKKAA